MTQLDLVTNIRNDKKDRRLSGGCVGTGWRGCRYRSHSSKTSSGTVHMTKGYTRRGGPSNVKETRWRGWPGGLEEGRRERPWVSTEDGVPGPVAGGCLK